MSDADPPPPEIQELARRTMDLWREQMRRMAHDPEAIELMTRSFALATKGLDAFTAGMEDAVAATPPQEETGHAPTEPPTNPPPGAGADPTAPRPAPAADASGGGGDDPAVLHDRITALEERLSALERVCAARCGGAAD